MSARRPPAEAEARRSGPVRRALRLVFGALLALAVLLSLLPGETTGVLPPPPVAPGASAEEIAASLLASERLVGDVPEAAAKEVVWAGRPGDVTPLSVVHVHGFAATKARRAATAERVAEALGANLLHTRLAGHGRGEAALSRAEAGHWMLDMAEALAVGETLGDEVVVLAEDLGAALAALASVEPAGREGVAAYVFLAPAFELRTPAARLLRLPFARQVAPALLGPVSAPGDGAVRVPTEALVPLAAVVDAAALTEYATASAPALFLISDADRISEPEVAREVARRWGAGGATVAPLEAAEAAEEADPTALTVIDWLRARGVGPDPAAEPSR